MSREESPDYLTLDDLLDIAAGVMDEVAVRDMGLLESAAARPRTTAFGEDAYPDFVHKAVALMHSIARNRALVDGNKRLAWAATRVFCLLNGHDLVMPAEEAEMTVVRVAAGRLDVPKLATSLELHLR